MFGGRLHYVPHTYTGIAVSLLFLGAPGISAHAGVRRRTCARTLANAATAAAPAADPSQAFAPASMVRSPLTVGIFFVLAGYYLCYYGWVLWKSKHLEAADIEADSSAPSQ